jgi:hypothetical protein
VATETRLATIEGAMARLHGQLEMMTSDLDKCRAEAGDRAGQAHLSRGRGGTARSGPCLPSWPGHRHTSRTLGLQPLAPIAATGDPVLVGDSRGWRACGGSGSG